MSDRSEKGEEPPKNLRKRYFSDGSEIFHQRTVRRRNADLESALYQGEYIFPLLLVFTSRSFTINYIAMLE